MVMVSPNVKITTTMKRIIFVLPLSVLLTYCSSSKQTTIPAGISNVQVNGAASTTASTGQTNQTRDWGYSSVKDTSLNGSWQLEGMAAADGSWKGADTWVPVDTSMSAMQNEAANSATVMPETGEGSIAGNTGTPGKNAQAGMNKKDKKTGDKNATGKSFGQSLFDTSMHYFDTLAFQQKLDSSMNQPFRYWQRLPEMRIMADQGIFTGNTGCNSMSGSFSFSGNDIKVDNKLRTSKMACNDYDENLFISNLLKAESYTINNGVLELKNGGTTVLTFRRKV